MTILVGRNLIDAVRVLVPSLIGEPAVIEHESRTSALEPFHLDIYTRSRAMHADGSPLLDPDLLSTASHAYLDALEVLRARSRSALRPHVRHTLATKILDFAIFGERNRTLLTERALAHFP